MKINEPIKQTIKCPYCDTEYLPSEIFCPNYFLGQEYNVERDTLGQILYYEGIDADHMETYICDKCNKQFKVEADIKFTVTADNINNVNENYYTPKPVKLFLDED